MIRAERRRRRHVAQQAMELLSQIPAGRPATPAAWARRALDPEDDEAQLYMARLYLEAYIRHIVQTGKDARGHRGR